MSLNIKNGETHRLAADLATLTGESMTRAVTVALRERLERVRRSQGASAAELLEIGRRCAAHLEAPPVEHGDLLYDDRGLPK
jgi:antitoxin VapB